MEPARVNRSAILTAINVRPNPDSAHYILTRTANRAFTLKGEEGVTRRVQVGEPIRVSGATFTLTKQALRYPIIELRMVPSHTAVRLLQARMTVARPDREADIVEVSYESADRDLARAVPNAAAQLFISRRHGVKSMQARSTVTFLNDQLDTLGQQLRTHEGLLRRFREGANVVSLEAQGEAQVSRLAEFQADRDILNAERVSLAKLLDEIARTPVRPNEPSPYRRLIGFPTILSNQAATEMLRSLNEVENQRAEMLTRRTPEDPDVAVLSARISDMENGLRALVGTYLDGVANKISSLDTVLTMFATDLKQIPAKEIQLASFMRQAKATEEAYNVLQMRKKEAEIAAAVPDGSVRVVDPAIPPFKPIRPNKPVSFILALILGLALGATIAFLRENLDTTIHTREELQTESGLVPVLGMIPRIRTVSAVGNGRSRIPWRIWPQPVATSPETLRSRLVAGRNPRGSASEAYRTLRTNLTFAQVEKPPKTLVFTSPAPGDGKSTSSSNLAITLAQQGLRSILIDADMRRGTMHTALDTSSQPGLSDYLVGKSGLEDIIRQVQLADANFDFIPTGTLPPNPAELLASTRMQALLEHLDGE